MGEETYNKKEEMIILRAVLLETEEERRQGFQGYTLDEVEESLNRIIDDI